MPVNYVLSLSEFQIRFLFWVASGSPDNETRSWLLAGMQFIRVANKFEALEFVKHLGKSPSDLPPHWELLEKGEALIALLKLEETLSGMFKMDENPPAIPDIPKCDECDNPAISTAWDLKRDNGPEEPVAKYIHFGYPKHGCESHPVTSRKYNFFGDPE